MDTRSLPIGKTWYEIRAAVSGGVADLFIFDEIGIWGISAQDFARAFNEAMARKPAALHIHMNSPGGIVSDGVAIYNTIRRAEVPKTTFVEGWAASIAALIALAGDRVLIAENAMMMIHNPHGLVIGEASRMRKMAQVLDTIRDTLVVTFVRKTGEDDATIKAAMDAETWYTAAEAVEFGLADEVTEEAEAVALWSPEACGFDSFAPAYASAGSGGVFSEVRGRGAGSGGVESGKHFLATENTEDTEEDGTVEIRNLKELRAQHSGLVQEAEDTAASAIEATVREECATAQTAAVEAAVTAERERVTAILQMAEPGQSAAAVKHIEAGDSFQVAALALKDAKSDGLSDRIAQREKDDKKLDYGSSASADDDAGDARSDSGEDAIAAFEEAVAEKVSAGLSRAKAMSAVVKAQPELHKRYRIAYNLENGRKLAAASIASG